MVSTEFCNKKTIIMENSFWDIDVRTKKNIILILVVLLSTGNIYAQLQSALPIDAFGVWDRSAVSPDDDTY